jgi:hypothetical protein
VNSFADQFVESEKRILAAHSQCVATQNSAGADPTDLIEFFEKIARGIEKKEWSQSRQDAFYAIAHLNENYHVHPKALSKLLECARDPNLKFCRFEVLRALSQVREPSALELLVEGVVEYPDVDLAAGVE